MKRSTTIAIILTSAAMTMGTVVFGQLSLVPYAGVNSTRMNTVGGYFENGGTYAFWGLDFSLRFKPSHYQRMYPTFVVGVSRLNNGYFYSSSFAFNSYYGYYNQQITDLRTSYWQMPMMARFNWQPFPLIEDWKLFLGAGVMANFITKATLHEEYTRSLVDLDNPTLAFPAPPVTIHYDESHDIMKFGRPTSFYWRAELGMKYKRLQISYRLSRSIPDLYFSGFETIWIIPSEDSNYIQTHEANGKIKEKYSEIAVGFRIGKE